MWTLVFILTGIGCICLSKKFREMVKNVPISIISSLVSYNEKIKNMYRKRKIIQGGIRSSIKDAFILKLRLFVIEKLNVGKLDVHKNHYELTYYHGSHKYKVIFNKKRGPKEILHVETLPQNSEEGKDITEEVFEAMGPSRNFYGIETTPKLLGYEQGLKIKYRNGYTNIYFPNDVIQCSSKSW